MKTISATIFLMIMLSPIGAFSQTNKPVQLTASQEQFQTFTELPNDIPIMMMNLVKFKDKVEGTDLTGRQVYQKYVDAALKFSKQLGAEVLWYGKPIHNLVGPADEILWDAMFVIKYPNKAKFFELARNPDIPNQSRTQALTNYRLIVCSADGNLFQK